jgi:DNA-binding winged helix-turn-helix (wHTH) protein/tetratricopeptide (TPR) repeat protein
MSGKQTEEKTKSSEVIFLGSFWFNIKSLTLFSIDKRPIPLRRQSALVLTELAKTPGETVSKDRLVSAVWGATFVTDDSLVQCIKDIRKAISDDDRKIIQTVPGVGYCLDANQPDALPANLPPSVLIKKIQCTGNSQVALGFAKDFEDKLVLVMAPRTSVRIFTKASSQFPADYIVQGRVSVSGDRVNLFLTLSEIQSRGVFYAESFKIDIFEIDQLAEDVARKISSVLRISVITHGGEKYANIADERLDFQQLMAKAHYFYSRITVSDTAVGRATSQVAVKISPDNPKALALLAHSATQMHPLVKLDTSENETEWAMLLADKAIALGPSSSFAFRTRANLRLWLLGDHEGCRADCDRALAINPNFYLTHLTLATSEILTGAYAAGMDRIDAFVCLTTIDQQYPYFQSLVGLACMLAGDVGASITFALEAHERSPRTSWHAMVYAAAAADDPSITKTEEFREMINGLELPLSHFRSMPFADINSVEFLEARLKAVGVAE